MTPIKKSSFLLCLLLLGVFTTSSCRVEAQPCLALL
jgi:hypothetical protein